MSLLAQIGTIDMSDGRPDGFSAGYNKTRIDLNQLEAFATAVEAAIAKAGLTAVVNKAQIKGSGERSDGTKVCRYSILIENESGRRLGGVSVYDSGSVNWDKMSPKFVGTPDPTAPAPTKARKSRKPAANQEVGEAAVSV